MAMLASAGSPLERDPYVTPAGGERGKAALLLGCVMEGLFTDTNRATERVLRMNGFATVSARGQVAVARSTRTRVTWIRRGFWRGAISLRSRNRMRT